ncbi:MAG: glycosyltransferase family 2 protein [Thermodesulfobacteriota bacterium]
MTPSRTGLQAGPTDVELSVVVPVFNEADNIGPLVKEIRAVLDGLVHYELIYVDDGSDDETAKHLEEMALDFPFLRVFRHRQRCGQTSAIRTGVKAAKAPWIATLDGDGQNDPMDIPRLWKLLKGKTSGESNLLVVGYRRKRRDVWIKRISSRIANAVRSRLLKDGTPDTGSGLKLFSREAFLELPYFDHMHRFFPALFLRGGGRVVSVEVKHRERKHGTSKYGIHDRLWVGIVDMLGVMWLQRRVKLPYVEKKG